jgi:type IV pilus assembly protein PilV
MSMIATKRKHTAMRGMAILETLVGILIFSIALIGLLGLQAQSIKNNSQAKFRADASFLASRVLAEMNLDRANIANAAVQSAYAVGWNLEAAQKLPNGTVTVAVNGSMVTVTVSWQPDAETAGATATGYRHSFTTVASMNAGDV